MAESLQREGLVRREALENMGRRESDQSREVQSVGISRTTRIRRLSKNVRLTIEAAISTGVRASTKIKMTDEKTEINQQSF